MNLFEMIASQVSDNGWGNLLSVEEPKTGLKWTFNQLLNEACKSADVMKRLYSRGDTMVFKGFWTPQFWADYLASEKIGLNKSVAAAPNVKPHDHIKGYDEGGYTIVYSSGTTGSPKAIVQTADRFRIMLKKYDNSPNIPKQEVGQRLGLALPPVPAGFADIVKATMRGMTVVMLQGLPYFEQWPAIPKYRLDDMTMVGTTGTNIVYLDEKVDLSHMHGRVYLVGVPIRDKVFIKTNQTVIEYGGANPTKILYGSSEDGLPTSSTIDSYNGAGFVTLDGVVYYIPEPDENGYGLLEIYPDGMQALEFYQDSKLTAEHFRPDGTVKTEDIFTQKDGLWVPCGRSKEKFSDGRLVFDAANRIGDFESVYDLRMLPSKDGNGLYAHITTVEGNPSRMDDIRAHAQPIMQEYPEILGVKYWDVFPMSVNTFKPDVVKMMEET